MTQRQLAEMLGVTGSRISNWEQGTNRPDADMLSDLCRALKVSPSVMLDVRLTEDDFTERERKIIYAYRSSPKVQHAIDILLGLDDNI
ncbi:MAG: helix-turn-helix transcriptional regulator [Clostridia bacterium]|nr:helix-turn-helix transcriptional regulator [Clostridia bacterium]